MKNIVFTGVPGRFGEHLKKIKSNHNLFFPNKKDLNILKPKSIETYLKNIQKIYLKKKDNLGMPFDSSLNINKLNKILKK